MGRFIPLKFQLVRFFALMGALFISLNFCQDLWAAQDAMVVADKAVIYADEQMSAPVGFVRKNKKIKVGEISRNRAQVYPIVVSGKVAYIRVVDVSTEKESVDSQVLVAERFQKGTQQDFNANYSASVFNYSTQISMQFENDELKDKDAVNWTGVGLRGGGNITEKWDFDVLLNYMNAKAQTEVFRAVEVGFGGAYHIFDKKRFKLKALVQLLGIPWASYSLGDIYRVNGFGFSTGGGLSMSYRLGKHFGLEGFGGFYYTSLSGFKTPDPYEDIAPTFIGTRLGLGLNYEY